MRNFLRLVSVLLVSATLGTTAWAQGAPNIVWARAGIDLTTAQFVVSPDGTRIAVAHRERIRILDASSGAHVRSFMNGSLINFLTWVADGSIVTSYGTQLRVWNPATGTLTRTLTTVAPEAPITASATGTYVAIPASNGELWNIATGTRVSVLSSRCGRGSIQFTGTGLEAWTFCQPQDHYANVVPALVNLADGSEVRRHTVTFDSPFLFTLSPNAQLAAVAMNGRVRIVRTTDWTTVHERVGTNRFAPLFLPDGSHVINAVEPSGGTGRIEAIRVSDGALARSFDPEADLGGTGSYRFAISSTGTLFTSGEAIRRWPAILSESTPVEVVMPGPLGVTSLLWTPDATQIISTIGTEGQLLSTPRLAYQLIRVWDANTGALVRAIDNGAPVTAAALVGNTGKLLTISATDSTLKAFNIATGAHIQTVNLTSTPTYLATSVDGNLVAISYRTSDIESGRIDLHSAADLSLVRRLTVPTLQIGRFTFSPDSTMLAAAGNHPLDDATGLGAGALVVWNVDGTLRFAQRQVGRFRSARAVTYSPDGQTIAVIGATGGTSQGGPEGGGGWLRRFSASDGTLLGGTLSRRYDLAVAWSNGTIMTAGFNGLRFHRAGTDRADILLDDEVGTTNAGEAPQVQAVALYPFSEEYRFAYATRDGTVVVAEVPTNDTCVPDVQIDARSFAASGGTATARLTFPAGTSSCPWTVTAADGWLTPSATAGSGSATITVAVAPLTTSASRAGTVTIAGHTIGFAQAGTLCAFDFSPSAIAVGPGAQQLSIAVTTSSTCRWTAAHVVPWLLPDDTFQEYGSTTGTGRIRLSLAANRTSFARAHTLHVGGRTIGISQAASCSFAVSPSAAAASAAGGSGTITIDTQTGCSWTASSNATWLTISASAGSGNAQLTWTAVVNSLTTARSGVVNVGGQSVTITQEAAPPAGVPGAPRNFAAQVVGSSVSFAWDAPSDGAAPTSYVLQAGSTPGATNLATVPLAATARSYQVSSVPNGTYYVRLRAVNAVGSGAASTELTVLVGVTVAPGAPRSLTATAVGNTVTLQWLAPLTGGAPTSYVIDAGSAAGTSNLASFSTGNTSLSYTAVGVANGTYFIRVRAANASGTSGYSNEAIAVVTGAGCSGPPAAPSGLTSSLDGRLVTLDWSAPAGPNAANDYRIEVGSAPTLADLMVFDTGNSATTLYANAQPGTFYVRVRGANACGYGPVSNTIVLAVP